MEFAKGVPHATSRKSSTHDLSGTMYLSVTISIDESIAIHSSAGFSLCGSFKSQVPTVSKHLFFESSNHEDLEVRTA